MVFGRIYKIEFFNKKCYIGLTTRSLEKRTREHKCCAKYGNIKPLYRALRKYKMEDTFELIEIDSAETFEELCEKEIYYIQEYNSYYKNGYGYNMTFGGEGTNGYKYTEEQRKKNSESQKKRFENPEERKKLSEIHKKRYEDNPEARKKTSEAILKYFENPEARKKASEGQKKRYEDNPEAGKAHSERLKKIYKDNPQARRKLSEGRGKNKPFNIYKKDGPFIKTFTYMFEAKEYLRKEYDIKSRIQIGEVLRGRYKSSAGFVFKYK